MICFDLAEALEVMVICYPQPEVRGVTGTQVGRQKCLWQASHTWVWSGQNSGDPRLARPRVDGHGTGFGKTRPGHPTSSRGRPSVVAEQIGVCFSPGLDWTQELCFVRGLAGCVTTGPTWYVLQIHILYTCQVKLKEGGSLRRRVGRW